MASGWVHATVDLLAFGRSYFDAHKKKDLPWRDLGYKHRVVNHPWYHQLGRKWNLDNPFPSYILDKTASAKDPDTAERFQSWISHDYLDRIWDTLDESERRDVERGFKQLLETPEKINKMAQIDVVKGLIYRVVDGKDVIEECPELIHEYNRLRAYVSKVEI